MNGHRSLLIGTVAFLIFAALVAWPTPLVAQAVCTFSTGFQALHDAIPEVVGDCVGAEATNPASGNVEQPTANGKLIWRPGDGLTGFTNGQTLWLAGPDGTVSRAIQDSPFPWEVTALVLPAPLSAAPAAEPATTPTADTEIKPDWVLLHESSQEIISEGVLAGFGFGFKRAVNSLIPIPPGGRVRIVYALTSYRTKGDVSISSRGGGFFGNGQPADHRLSRGIVNCTEGVEGTWSGTSGTGELISGEGRWTLQQAIGDGKVHLITPNGFARTPTRDAIVEVILEPDGLNGTIGIPALGAEQPSVAFTLLKSVYADNPSHGLAAAVWSGSNTTTILKKIAFYTHPA